MTTISNLPTSSNPNKDDNNGNGNDDNEKLSVRRRAVKSASSSPSTGISSSIPPLVCQICHTQSSRYTCPRCYVHTCSLQCCKVHKINQSCNGKRDLTKYIPLSKMNDTLILSDYHFLQNGTSTMDTTRRLWNQMNSSDDHDNTQNHHSNNSNNHHSSNNHNNHNNNKKRPRHDHHQTNQIDSTVTVPSPHPILQAATNAATIAMFNNVTHTSLQQPPTLVLKKSNIRFQNHHHHHNNNNKSILFTPMNLIKFNQIHLLVLPNIMERHQMNQSHYVYTNTTTSTNTTIPPVILHWTMEICFVSNNTKESSCDTTTTKHDNTNTVTIVLHLIPETITLEELQKKAIQQLQHQQIHHPQRIHRSWISLPIVPIANYNDNNMIKTDIDDDDDDDDHCTTDNTTTYTWYMKQIPCPAHCPTYIPIAKTTTTTITQVQSIRENDNKSIQTSDHTINDTTTTTPGILLKDVLCHRTIIEFPTIYLKK